MTAVAALQEFRDGNLVSNEAARVHSSRDQVAVTIRMKNSKETAPEAAPCEGRDQLCPAAQDKFDCASSWSRVASRSGEKHGQKTLSFKDTDLT